MVVLMMTTLVRDALIEIPADKMTNYDRCSGRTLLNVFAHWNSAGVRSRSSGIGVPFNPPIALSISTNSCLHGGYA